MLLFLWSCSLMVPSLDWCESTLQCQNTFGMGYTCGDEGFCDLFDPHERCASTFPEDLYENWSKYAGSYIIGTLFNHSTDQANLVATTLAIEEARDFPLDGDQSFVMIHCDYESQNEMGDGLSSNDATREISRHLSEEVGAKVVVGPAGSEGASISFNATEDLLIISPSATSETLSTIDGDTKSDESPGRFWRTVASDALQARVLALVVSMKGRSNLGFVYENSVYGAGFIAIMEDALPSTISSMRYPYNVGDRDTAESQRELAGMSMHDGIVFISSDISDLTGFLDEIEMDEAYQGQFLFFADGAADSAFLESTIQLLDTGVQIFGSRPPLLDGALFNNFEAIYRLKADAMGFPDLEASEDVYAAYTYDATWMALYGYAWAYFQEDPFTFDGLARGLRKLSNIEEDTVDVGFSSWNTIQTKFSSGTAVNIRGASGELDFQPATEELDSNVEIWSLGSTYSCFALNYVCTSDLACIEAEPSMDCP